MKVTGSFCHIPILVVPHVKGYILHSLCFPRGRFFWTKHSIPSLYFCPEDLTVGLAEMEAVVTARHHNNIIVIIIIIV